MDTFTHTTPLGEMISQWTTTGLYRLEWNSECVSGHPEVTESPTEEAAALDSLLRTFFSTGQADFLSVQVDPEGWTPLSERVYAACRRIEPGTTTTYKRLAEAAGNPGASRAVGGAMARNRILLVIPCHRVIASDGKLRGFSAPGGLVTKQRLLDLESL